MELGPGETFFLLIMVLNIIKKFLILLKGHVSIVVNSLESINRENILYILDVDKGINQHISHDITDLFSLWHKPLLRN